VEWDDEWGSDWDPASPPRVFHYVPLILGVAATIMLVVGSVIGLRNNNDFRCATASVAETWISIGLFVTIFVAIPGALWVLLRRRVDIRVGLVSLAISIAPLVIAFWLVNHPDSSRFWGCDPS
jgi:hypothetical protein